MFSILLKRFPHFRFLFMDCLLEALEHFVGTFGLLGFKKGPCASSWSSGQPLMASRSFGFCKVRLKMMTQALIHQVKILNSFRDLSILCKTRVSHSLCSCAPIVVRLGADMARYLGISDSQENCWYHELNVMHSLHLDS